MLKLKKQITIFMGRGSLAQTFYLLLVNAIKAVFYFPFWWYSKGFLKVLKGSWQTIKDFNLTLGFTIWLKNLFVPMYGQSDIWGRAISIVLRFFQIIVRGLILLIFLIFVLVFIIVWLVLPGFVVLKIITYLI